MAQAIDFEQVITQAIKGLPQHYLGEIADFVFFLREKQTKQQFSNLENKDRKKAMLEWLAHNRLHAKKIDSSVNIRALIDQTHDTEL